jgi:Family of unknown function (DUF5706)
MAGAAPPSPPGGASDERREEFLQHALAAAGEWARFADPKALAVIVLLGLGLSDLLGYAKPLTEAHQQAGAWATIATAAFWVAVLAAVLTVCCVSLAVFPRLASDFLARHHGTTSLYYFGGIADYEDAEAYQRAVHAASRDDLQDEIARQAYEVAVIAKRKHAWTQRAYVAVLGFLGAWAVARIGLSFLA